MRFKKYILLLLIVGLFKLSLADPINFGIIAPPTYETAVKLLETFEFKGFKLDVFDKILFKRVRKSVYLTMLNQQSVIAKQMNKRINRIYLKLNDNPNVCFSYSATCSKYVSAFYLSNNIGDDKDILNNVLFSVFDSQIPYCFTVPNIAECIEKENNVDIILYVDFLIDPEKDIQTDYKGRIKLKELTVQISSLLSQTNVIQSEEINITRDEMKNFNYINSIITEKTQKIIKESLATYEASNSIKNNKSKSRGKGNESSLF